MYKSTCGLKGMSRFSPFSSSFSKSQQGWQFCHFLQYNLALKTGTIDRAADFWKDMISVYETFY